MTTANPKNPSGAHTIARARRIATELLLETGALRMCYVHLDVMLDTLDSAAEAEALNNGLGLIMADNERVAGVGPQELRIAMTDVLHATADECGFCESNRNS